jgi:hypothetical protein
MPWEISPFGNWLLLYFLFSFSFIVDLKVTETVVLLVSFVENSQEFKSLSVQLGGPSQHIASDIFFQENTKALRVNSLIERVCYKHRETTPEYNVTLGQWEAAPLIPKPQLPPTLWPQTLSCSDLKDIVRLQLRFG